MAISTKTAAQVPGRQYLSGMAVKILLIERGWMMKELSAEAGIDYERLVKIVGGYRSVRREELQQLAEVLGCNQSRLLK